MCHHPGSSPNISPCPNDLGTFVDDSLYRYDSLNYWSLAINSTARPSPSWRSGVRCSSLLITWLVLLTASPHPILRGLSRSHPMNKLKCGWKGLVRNNQRSLALIISEIPRVEELCVKNGRPDMYSWPLNTIGAPILPTCNSQKSAYTFWLPKNFPNKTTVDLKPYW